MNNLARYLIRITFGSIASLAILFVLDLIPWKLDAVDYDAISLYFLLSITTSASVLIAAFTGAIVARVNFLGPAFALSILGWALMASFLSAVSAAYSSDDFVPFLVANAGSFTIVIGGGICGALLGQRICKPIGDEALNSA